jgi:CRISPR-associated protein Cmr2
MPDPAVQSYAGFTIGPIYEVMRHSRKTRELWFGSYFFSWYMETLIDKLIRSEAGEFLTPYTKLSGGGLEPNRSVTGKYHDRFVLRSPHPARPLFDTIDANNSEVLEFFTDLIFDLAREEHRRGGEWIDSDRDSIRGILTGFLQTRFFTTEAEHIDAQKPIAQVDQYLNSLEESFIFRPGKSRHTCERCKTLPGIVKIKERVAEGRPEARLNIAPLCPVCFVKFRANRIDPLVKHKLPREALKDGKLIYPPIQEIAARELFDDESVRQRLTPDEEGEIGFDQLETVLGELQKPGPAPYHRYFAVVQADGDNLGKLAATISDPTELSRRLFEFAEASERLITGFGGTPIFIGGDDLLSFMPVYFEGKTVVDFASEISAIYRETVDKNEGKTSLSLGINIAYYKFPLSTALDQAGGLLFGDAKADKDSLALCLTQHAGSQTRFVLPIAGDKFARFAELLRGALNAAKADREKAEPPEDSIRLPGGLAHNLGRFQRLIAEIPDTNRLNAFFENNFNEGDHLDFHSGLDTVNRLLAHYLFEREADAGEAVGTVLKMLKFIRFLTRKEDA